MAGGILFQRAHIFTFPSLSLFFLSSVCTGMAAQRGGARKELLAPPLCAAVLSLYPH